MSTDDRYTENDEYSDATYAETDETYAETYDDADEDDGSWLGEGVIGLLLVAGVVLFFFPEPTTSMIGIALVSIAVVAWIVDWIL